MALGLLALCTFDRRKEKKVFLVCLKTTQKRQEEIKKNTSRFRNSTLFIYEEDNNVLFSYLPQVTNPFFVKAFPKQRMHLLQNDTELIVKCEFVPVIFVHDQVKDVPKT